MARCCQVPGDEFITIPRCLAIKPFPQLTCGKTNAFAGKTCFGLGKSLLNQQNLSLPCLLGLRLESRRLTAGAKAAWAQRMVSLGVGERGHGHGCGQDRGRGLWA